MVIHLLLSGSLHFCCLMGCTLQAFDVLERLDPNPEYWDAKRGAAIGVFQMIVAGKEQVGGSAGWCCDIVKFFQPLRKLPRLFVCSLPRTRGSGWRWSARWRGGRGRIMICYTLGSEHCGITWLRHTLHVMCLSSNSLFVDQTLLSVTCS
jgi:hypothetical protein